MCNCTSEDAPSWRGPGIHIRCWLWIPGAPLRGALSDKRCRNDVSCCFAPFLYLKIEIPRTVPWRVEILNEPVAAEIASLPADMQARFLRLAERVASAGLESLSESHVKHLEGKLWELRLTGRDGIARALYVTAIGRRVVVVRAS
jgi:phage-related protein